MQRFADWKLNKNDWNDGQNPGIYKSPGAVFIKSKLFMNFRPPVEMKL